MIPGWRISKNLLSKGFSRPDPFQSNWALGISVVANFDILTGLTGGCWLATTSVLVGSNGWRLKLAANIGIEGFQGGS